MRTGIGLAVGLYVRVFLASLMRVAYAFDVSLAFILCRNGGSYDVKPALVLALAGLIIGIAPLQVSAGETSRLSLNAASGDSDGLSSGVAVSSDGHYVVFQSTATDLMASPTNGASQIFRRDTQTGTTILISTDDFSVQGTADSFEPAVSADGNLVVFASNATNLIDAADTNGVSDIFLRNVTAGTTIRVSVATGGGEATSRPRSSSGSACGRQRATWVAKSPNRASGHAALKVYALNRAS